jgi:hypothetical protein
LLHIFGIIPFFLFSFSLSFSSSACLPPKGAVLGLFRLLLLGEEEEALLGLLGTVLLAPMQALLL